MHKVTYQWKSIVRLTLAGSLLDRNRIAETSKSTRGRDQRPTDWSNRRGRMQQKNEERNGEWDKNKEELCSSSRDYVRTADT